MSKRKRQQSTSQKILWFLSLLIVASMVVSLVIVALPSPPAPEPTPEPTLIPQPSPTFTPLPLPTFTSPPQPTEPAPTPSPQPSPTPEETEAIIGPAPPTATPTITPTITITPTSASLGFSFSVCGDSRGNPDTYRKVLEAVMADGSEFLIHTGDLVNEGTESLWQEFQATMAGFALPFYPVPGNHDSLDGQLDGYLTYSRAPAAHYAFDQGPVHFTLADSHNGGIGARELDWLREDLLSTDQPIKMVFLHHPPFDPDGTDHIMAYGQEAFMTLMAEQEVDYVFAGHIHAYAQEERDGIVYTISGGAGAPLYTGDHPQAFYHYLRVSIQDRAVAIEVVKI